MEPQRIVDRKILPIQSSPTTAWPETNFLLSVLKTIPKGWEWALNSHIQLRGARYENFRWNIRDSRITFYPYGMHDLTPNVFDLCPFVDKYSIPRKMVNAIVGEFHTYVENAIVRGFYLSTYVDQFFREDIGRIGYHHPVYIYGFDQDRQEVYLLDNFEQGKFAAKTLSYEILDFAYGCIEDRQWESSIFLYSFHEKEGFVFDPEFVCDQIQDYLSPGRGICYLSKMLCSSNHFRGEEYSNDIYFGMECYDFLNEYLQQLEQNNRNGDIRSFCLVTDHKQLMVERYFYMKENHGIKSGNHLEDLLQKQLSDSKVMNYLFLKYMLKKDTVIIRQIREILHDFIPKEVETMHCFLEAIAVKE